MVELFENYLDGAGPASDEMFEGSLLRGPYERLADSLAEVTGAEVRAFPLGIMPRVIEQDAASVIDRGVQQRVKALELFLDDAYDTAGSSTTGWCRARW